MGFWAVLLVGIFGWAPALYPGYWQGWRGFVPVYQLTAADVAAADLWRGTGPLLLAQPLLQLGLDPVQATRTLFVLALILGGSSVYAWLGGRLGDRGAGLAGVGYMLLPLVLDTTYLRGSPGEAMLLGLAPLTLAGLAGWSERRSPAGAAVAVLGLVWMWHTQAGLAAATTVWLACYTLFVERDRSQLWIVLAGGAAGLAALLPLGGNSSPPPVPFFDHFAEFYILLDLAAGWLGGPPSRQPYQLGGVLVLTALGVGWGLSVKKLPAALSRLLWFSLGSLLVALLLALPISAPLWQLLAADLLFTYPWQLLLAAAPFLAALLGALPALFPELETAAHWVALLVLVVLGSLGALQPDYTQVQPAARPVALFGERQILVIHARLTEQPSPPSALLEVTWQPLRTLPVDYNIFFQALTADGQKVAQLDMQPLGEAQPATQWRPGQILQNTYSLDLSAAPPGVPLTYLYGYYDWRDGTRLSLVGSNDDKLVLNGR